MNTDVIIDIDPAYIGPGTWVTLHTLAFHATSDSKKEQFRETLDLIIKNFMCQICREHALQYLQDHDIRAYDDATLGYFIYIWKFHNTVNRRLGKMEMDFETALAIYSNNYTNICKHCTVEEEPTSPRTKPVYQSVKKDLSSSTSGQFVPRFM